MMMPHHPYLDGWRGIAIALVLAGHFLPVRGIDLGPLGVDFFFALSGLLMARLLFIQQTPISTFYLRRGSRILPAVLVYILMAAITLPLGAAALLASLTLTVNYARVPPELGHLWSLSVEEHCYVLLSIIAVVTRTGAVDARKAVGTTALGFALVTLVYAAVSKGFPAKETQVAGFGIFASAFLAIALNVKRRVPSSVVVVLIAIGFGSHWWSVPVVAHVIIGMAAFALAVNLLPQTPGLHRAFSLTPLRILGTWSYSIYLWQQLFYTSANAGTIPRWVGVPASVVVGALSFYAIEQPARRYINNLAKSRETSALSNTSRI